MHLCKVSNDQPPVSLRQPCRKAFQYFFAIRCAGVPSLLVLHDVVAYAIVGANHGHVYRRLYLAARSFYQCGYVAEQLVEVLPISRMCHTYLLIPVWQDKDKSIFLDMAGRAA